MKKYYLERAAQLDLRVAKVEVVDKVQSKVLGTTTSVARPKEGFKMVVVTLEGTVPCRALFTLRTDMFCAISVTGMDFDITRSSAIASDAGYWQIVKEGEIAERKIAREQVGPIVVQTAFMIPDEVITFYVLCPMLVKNGTVELQGHSPEKGDH